MRRVLIKCFGGHLVDNKGQPTTVGWHYLQGVKQSSSEEGQNLKPCLCRSSGQGVEMMAVLKHNSQSAAKVSRQMIAHLHIEYVIQTETDHQLFSKLLTLGLAIKTVCVIDFYTVQ